MILLTLDDLLRIARRTLGGEPMVRDLGLLDAAAARPRAAYGGAELYPGLEFKAAALVHSIARNHALVDGDKRLALAALIVFLGVNGVRLTMSDDEAYDVTIAVASGGLDDIEEIAHAVAQATTSL